MSSAARARGFRERAGGGLRFRRKTTHTTRREQRCLLPRGSRARLGGTSKRHIRHMTSDAAHPQPTSKQARLLPPQSAAASAFASASASTAAGSTASGQVWPAQGVKEKAVCCISSPWCPETVRRRVGVASAVRAGTPSLWMHSTYVVTFPRISTESAGRVD